MAEGLDRSSLRLVVAQVCLSLGWHSVTRFTLEILTDVIEKYLKKVSNTVAGFCQHDGRQSPTVGDVEFVFEHLGISSLELEDYLHQVEQAPLCRTVTQYPAEKVSQLKFSDVGEDERPDCYESHFPPLVSIVPKKEEDAVPPEEPPANDVDISQAGDGDSDSKSKKIPLLSRKRSYESPPYSPIEPKRLNLDAHLQIPDLTRPDLKVSTPKELSGKAAFDDHVSTSENHGRIPARVLVEKTHNVNEKLDSILKSREPGNVEKKESHSKDAEKKSTSFLSPPRERPVKEKVTAIPSPKPFEADKKVTLSPTKAVQAKSDRPLSSVAPSQVQTPALSPSPTKPKVNKSPKLAKSLSSPKAAETSKKSCTPLPQDTYHSISPLKSPDSLVSPISTTPKPLKKPAKLMKKVKKSGDSLKDKKKKKSITPIKGEKKESPVKLKISSFKITKDEGVPKKKKKKVEKSEKSSIIVGPSPFTSPAPAPEKHSVPKLVFKPLAHPSETFKVSTESKQSKKALEKEKTKAMKSPESSPLKKTLKITVGDSKGKKKDHGEKVKDTKVKSKSKKINISSSEDVKEKSSTKEKSSDSIMKFKLDSSAEEGIKMSFSSSMIKSMASPKKKQPSPMEPPLSSTPSVAPQPSVDPPKKKIKSDKKKKSLDIKEGTKSKGPKKLKGEKEAATKPVKIKKAKKEPLTPALIQPIPKLTLKMDSSTSTSNVTPTSKVVIKPLVSPTKTTDSGSGKKNKSASSTVSKQPPSAPPTPPQQIKKSTGAPPAPPAVSAGTSGASSGDDTPQRGVFTVTLATTNVATAEVYYCPACQRPDDGSPMIGCDGCDLWYHWPCVGVLYAPKDDEQWFCPACAEKQKKKKKKEEKRKLASKCDMHRVLENDDCSNMPKTMRISNLPVHCCAGFQVATVMIQVYELKSGKYRHQLLRLIPRK